jgi:hypothetical protein
MEVPYTSVLCSPSIVAVVVGMPCAAIICVVVGRRSLSSRTMVVASVLGTTC